MHGTRGPDAVAQPALTAGGFFFVDVEQKVLQTIEVSISRCAVDKWPLWFGDFT